MAHYALLDENNIVVNVITGIDETELIEGLPPEEWYGNFHNQTCIRTSYNNRIRKQYAIIGGQYLSDADVFLAPKPFPSWVLDENYDWQPPVEMPNDDRYYLWNEENLNWQENHDWPHQILPSND